MVYLYRCADFPGMEACPGSFTTASEAELWKLIEVHAATAHRENPDRWSSEDRQTMKNLIRTTT
jgi:predicted small metal-binding protein